jgi:DNA-binding beta-propeller fold protein YncE
VSKVDMVARRVVKTVDFPAGSKPYMLRVSPDGKEVWVQTAGSNTNTVLDAGDLSVLDTKVLGQAPATNSFTPDGRLSFVMHVRDPFVSVLDAKTYQELKRVEVGQTSQEAAFTADGRTAFITVAGMNQVAVVDVPRLELIDLLPAGTRPVGVLVLDAQLRPVSRRLPRTGGGPPPAMPALASLFSAGPGALGIGAALLVASLLRRRRLS